MPTLYDTLGELEKQSLEELKTTTTTQKEEQTEPLATLADAAPKEEEKPDDEKASTDEKDEQKQGKEPDAEAEKKAAEDEARRKSEEAIAGYKERKRRQMEKEAERAAQRAQEIPAQKPETDPEPDKTVDFERWQEWKIAKIERENAELRDMVDPNKNETLRALQTDMMQRRMEQGYQNLEQRFVAEDKPDDYEDVAMHMLGVYRNAAMVQYPFATPDQITQLVKSQILNMADAMIREGDENPVRTMYHLTKSRFGYVPRRKEDQTPEPTEEKKQPSNEKARLEAVAKNKKVSHSGLTAGGRSGAPSLTKEAFERMTNGEIANLTAEQIKQIEAAGW